MRCCGGSRIRSGFRRSAACSGSTGIRAASRRRCAARSRKACAEPSRARHIRRRREGRACRGGRRARSRHLRGAVVGPTPARLRQPHVGQGGQRRRPGRLSALSPRVLLHPAGGAWCVVQQGMNDANGMARRYHWLRRALHELRRRAARGGVPRGAGATLNLVADETRPSAEASAALARAEAERPCSHAMKELPLLDDAAAARCAAGRRQRAAPREDSAEDLRARARRTSRRCSGSKASARRRCARWRWRRSWCTARRRARAIRRASRSPTAARTGSRIPWTSKPTTDGRDAPRGRQQGEHRQDGARQGTQTAGRLRQSENHRP